MNEKNRDSIQSWILIFLATTVLFAVFYGIWADLIDGKLYNPVLEMGTRFKGPTHLIVNKTGTPLPIYHPGDMVYARVAMQKQRSVTGVIQWQLIDHKTIQYPERPGSLPIGIYDHVVAVERIPLDAEPGEHYFCGTVRYKVNWLSTVPYDLWTDKFLVEPKS